MTENKPPTNTEIEPTKKSTPSFRKGALVKVNRLAFSSAIEAKASDPNPPKYIFDGPGEILSITGDYGQIRWRKPVPDVWLRLDQLEPYN